MKVLSSKLFESRIQSYNTTAKEKFLGYLIGPAGALLVNALLAQGFLNVFYTDELGMSGVWGGLFLVIFPILSKILDAITNLIMGAIIDRTKTVQGKARPWLLLSVPLVVICGILLYFVPAHASTTVKAIYIIFTYNLYYCFAFTMYNITHMMMVPLSTRNDMQRSQLAVFNNIANIAITGILVALLFPMLVLPKIKGDIDAWVTFMTVAAIIMLPVMLLEYYFTKERVTLENPDKAEADNIAFKEKIKACMSNKNWWILVVFWLFYWVGQLTRSNAMTYYANWVLGSTYADGITQTLLNVIGGLPMGIGIFLVWPLSKKFGKKNVTATGFILCVIGDIITFIAPDNLVTVLIGQFIMNMGIVPAAYVFPALMAGVFDEIEYKHGFRCDGVATSVINSMNTIAVGLSIGIFNLLIRGYIQPEFDAAGNCITTQPDSVISAIVWAFVGMNIFIHAGLAILLRFLDVELKLPAIQKIIRQRQVDKCKANGEEWIEPAEKARLIQEELDAKAIESFKAELKEKCAKNKKLNYDAELDKYIKKFKEQKEKARIKAEKELCDEAEYTRKMEEQAKKKGVKI